MIQHLRVTVIGTRRKADLALPGTHRIEELLPEIIGLLQEPIAHSEYVLTTLAGSPVDPRASLTDNGIDNGAVLQLTPRDHAPQAPDVAEIAEAVGDATVRRPDRWRPQLTTYFLSATVVLATLVASVALPLNTPTTALVLGALIVVAALAGMLSSILGNTGATWALWGAGIGAAAPFGFAIGALSLFDPAQTVVMVVLTTWAVIWTVTAIVFGIGGRRRGVIAGVILALVTWGAFAALTVWGVPIITIALFAGVISAAILGFAPSWALALSGVGRLDDAVVEGRTVPRQEFSAAISDAFSAQTALVLAATVPLAGSIMVLAAGGPWQLGLAAAVTVFALARSRLFPLAVARGALLVATVLPAAVWLVVTPLLLPWAIVAIALVVLNATIILASSTFSASAQARFRRLLGLLEALAVIATIPLLLGSLGIFGDLLGTFS